MKKTEFNKEIKELTVQQLREKNLELSEELMKLRFNHAVGQLEQTHRLGQVQRNIARVQTQISLKEAAK